MIKCQIPVSLPTEGRKPTQHRLKDEEADSVYILFFHFARNNQAYLIHNFEGRCSSMINKQI